MKFGGTRVGREFRTRVGLMAIPAVRVIVALGAVEVRRLPNLRPAYLGHPTVADPLMNTRHHFL